jgi:hypothetical protein
MDLSKWYHKEEATEEEPAGNFATSWPSRSDGVPSKNWPVSTKPAAALQLSFVAAVHYFSEQSFDVAGAFEQEAPA